MGGEVFGKGICVLSCGSMMRGVTPRIVGGGSREPFYKLDIINPDNMHFEFICDSDTVSRARGSSGEVHGRRFRHHVALGRRYRRHFHRRGGGGGRRAPYSEGPDYLSGARGGP